MYTATRWMCLACLLAGVAGCGGGASSVPATPAVPPATPPTATGPPTVRTALRVEVTDENGVAVERAIVRLARDAQATDARGVVEFPAADFPPTTRQLLVDPWEQDLYGASASFLPADGRIVVAVRLLRNRTVAVLGARTVQRSPAGDRLTAELDFAVYARDGRNEVVRAEAISVTTLDCGWSPADCATGPDGRSVGMSGVYGIGSDTLTVASVAAGGRAPVVAGVLVDVGTSAVAWDTLGARYGALRTFFGSAGDAVVALGTITPGPTTPAPPSGFAVDGARFDAVLAALVGAGGLASTDGPAAYAAITAMGAAAAAAPAAAGARRSVVALLPAFWGIDDPCAAGIVCRRSLDAAIARARSSGVRVVTLGEDDQLADLAVRTGGIHVDVDRPVEMNGAARALASLLDGSAPRQRATFDLTGVPGTFVAGGTVYAQLVITFAPSQLEFVNVAIPLPD